MDELRDSLAVILAFEELEPTDWSEMERLSSQLHREVQIDATPEAVHRYLDNADIPCRDGVPDEIVERAGASAAQQGKRMTTLDEVWRWLDTFEVPLGG